MRKNVFVIAMVVETLAALIAMGLLFSDVGAIIYPISLAIFAVVLAPFYLRLRKVTEEEKKRKIRRNMALVLLLPIVVAVIMVAIVVIGLMIYFGT